MTMKEVASTRLTSLEPVTTGVGSVSRAAHIEGGCDQFLFIYPGCDLRYSTTLIIWLRWSISNQIYIDRGRQVGGRGLSDILVIKIILVIVLVSFCRFILVII